MRASMGIRNEFLTDALGFQLVVVFLKEFLIFHGLLEVKEDSIGRVQNFKSLPRYYKKTV